MASPRIFTDRDINPGAELELDQRASRHLAGALRLREGAGLVLFDGEGLEFPAQITRVDRRSVHVLPGEGQARSLESPLGIHLGIGISRGERMDWVLQKSTELGVTAVTPLFTERCEVKLRGEREDKKRAHWQQVVISACEQCGRNTLPQLHPPARLDDWLTHAEADLKLVLHHRADAADSAAKPRTLVLLVGPEGGLAETEIERARAAGFLATALGPRVLRTETAPLAAIAIAQASWGDMGVST